MERKPPKHILLLLASLLTGGIAACGMISRHSDSGYGHSHLAAASQDLDLWYTDRHQYQQQEAYRDLAHHPSGLAIDTEPAEVLSLRMQLQASENRLSSPHEIAQYYKFKSLMSSDLERIRFLKIGSLEAREKYARMRGWPQKLNEVAPEYKKLVESGDLAIGMNRTAVLESWGDPQAIETAGQAHYGNERWIYKKTVSSADGFRDEERIVYFDAGHVVGWRTL